MDKHFLVKWVRFCRTKLSGYLVVLFTCFSVINVYATETKEVNLSPLFIQLSDIMGEVKENNVQQAKIQLTDLAQNFTQFPQHTSVAGNEVSQAIEQAQTDLNQFSLTRISSALLAFEKEQHPIDVQAQKHQFEKRVLPAFVLLRQRIAEGNLEQIKVQYRIFNTIWVQNERTVRDVSLSYYGEIETAMALLRISIETTPVDFVKIDRKAQILDDLFQAYLSGQKAQIKVVGDYNLSDGITLLEEGLTAFKQGNINLGQEKLTHFIQIWPIIEGQVSTRNPSLYTQLESQIPIIVAQGKDLKQQQALQRLIGSLNQINPHQAYTMLDAMLILLREGLEALLVVMALVSALRVANRPQGYKWVTGGVVTGLMASILVAFALHTFFPSISSGANREVIEGIVGIIAVVMILTIGVWLHSKSSIQSWNAYLKQHMGKALTTGGFISLFSLSFLAVFREGAETILFYVGILPNISLTDFSLGIGAAILILLLLSLVMIKTSVKLPVPTMFRLLTWLLYILGFKILGVSVHSLQLIGYLPLKIIDSLPTIEWIGFYATTQTVFAQILYLAAIILLQRYMQLQEKRA
ncbi:FTR1 family iron permease [Mergibacter septicus]|uniref:FTR1 family iron permease n=1 Tax=Mergibacter septicus TaxID=221402 RepID=UPI00223F636B|nr:FTR1 family protein [Mergibacter septicus]